MLNPSRSDKIVKVLDVLSGNFVAAALTHTDENICVVKHLCCSTIKVSRDEMRNLGQLCLCSCWLQSVRNSGELQLWSADGICLGSLSLQTAVRFTTPEHSEQYHINTLVLSACENDFIQIIKMIRIEINL